MVVTATPDHGMTLRRTEGREILLYRVRSRGLQACLDAVHVADFVFEHLSNGKQSQRAESTSLLLTQRGRGPKRGFPNASTHCHIPDHYSGNPFCCTLVCVCHLDGFHGSSRFRGCCGGENSCDCAFD